jgi:tetratricopeptide (TPR) repeat protein
VLCAPITTDKAWYDFDNRAPIIEGLDVLHFPIKTKNSLAQEYFNQGLVLSYGFNHAEAARSFYYATKLDPDCAMAYWGFAYVLGPNYNAGMESDNYERAYTAIQQAVELSNNSTPKEKALIYALSERYVKDAVEDRRPLDIAYSKAMKKVFTDFPNNADIGTLYAESLMNLHPWDLWDKAGNAKAWTPEIISTLENVLEIDTKHPGAHHFYIHAVEASSEPEKGLYSSQLFDEGLVPGAGHLVHMPSHIYIRTGDYHKGTLSNIRAVEVDSVYVTACNAQGAYPLAYFPYNYHFMAATATLEGNSKWAIKASNKVSAHSNLQLMKLPGWGTIQHYYTIPYYVYVKFGKWKEILDMKNDDISLGYPEAVRHYARGMAFLGLKDIVSARKELLALEKYSNDKSLKKITIWDINSVDVLLQIAKRVLKAEILSSESNYTESIGLLKEATVIEDDLNYNEPPDWFFSVRHNLGAVQIEAEKYEDAIQTFNEDLERLPKNGWALHGLKQAYLKLDDKKKVDEIKTQLHAAWSTADIRLTTARIK